MRRRALAGVTRDAGLGCGVGTGCEGEPWEDVAVRGDVSGLPDRGGTVRRLTHALTPSIAQRCIARYGDSRWSAVLRRWV